MDVRKKHNIKNVLQHQHEPCAKRLTGVASLIGNTSTVAMMERIEGTNFLSVVDTL